MLELRGNKFKTGTPTFFFSSVLLSLFWSSISFCDQQFLPSEGFCLHKAGSLLRRARLFQPLQAPCTSHTPVLAALLKLVMVLFHEYLWLILGFSYFQILFLLLLSHLPPQTRVL